MKCLTLIAITLFFVSIVSCRSRGNKPDGGPCSYEVTPDPAIVFFIDSTNTEMVNIWCRVNALQPDTVDYYHTNNQYTTLSAIKLAKLQPGDTLIYEHHQIIDGACNPDVFRLLLKQEVK
jgi:hypothetical protein